jgi:hypothetical protein
VSALRPAAEQLARAQELRPAALSATAAPERAEAAVLAAAESVGPRVAE